MTDITFDLPESRQSDKDPHTIKEIYPSVLKPTSSYILPSTGSQITLGGVWVNPVPIAMLVINDVGKKKITNNPTIKPLNTA